MFLSGFGMYPFSPYYSPYYSRHNSYNHHNRHHNHCSNYYPNTAYYGGLSSLLLLQSSLLLNGYGRGYGYYY